MEGHGWSGWRRGREGVAWLEGCEVAGEKCGEEGVGGTGRGAWLEGWGVVGGIQLFNSGCLNRGRPDAMICGGSIICLFGC